MCMTIRNRKSRPRAKIAKSDIWVFKVIKTDGTGLYKSMSDKRGQLMLWKRGYHYTELSPVFSITRTLLFQWDISKGLHSCKTMEMAKWHWEPGAKIVKMIIPKGAKYYESGNEYVSDQLIYPKQRR